MKRLLLAGIIGFWSTSTLAHSPLENSTPADQTILEEVPSEVHLNFKGDIRLTRVSMSHADHPDVDLNLDGYDGFSTIFNLPLEAMGSGKYVIDWRGLGSDGHAMKGSFSFLVKE